MVSLFGAAYIRIFVGHFGPGCGTTCKCVFGTCDSQTGNCTCDAGFKDDTCSSYCEVIISLYIS